MASGIAWVLEGGSLYGLKRMKLVISEHPTWDVGTYPQGKGLGNWNGSGIEQKGGKKAGEEYGNELPECPRNFVTWVAEYKGSDLGNFVALHLYVSWTPGNLAWNANSSQISVLPP